MRSQFSGPGVRRHRMGSGGGWGDGEEGMSASHGGHIQDARAEDWACPASAELHLSWWVHTCLHCPSRGSWNPSPLCSCRGSGPSLTSRTSPLPGSCSLLGKVLPHPTPCPSEHWLHPLDSESWLPRPSPGSASSILVRARPAQLSSQDAPCPRLPKQECIRHHRICAEPSLRVRAERQRRKEPAARGSQRTRPFQAGRWGRGGGSYPSGETL